MLTCTLWIAGIALSYLFMGAIVWGLIDTRRGGDVLRWYDETYSLERSQLFGFSVNTGYWIRSLFWIFWPAFVIAYFRR